MLEHLRASTNVTIHCLQRPTAISLAASRWITRYVYRIRRLEFENLESSLLVYLVVDKVLEILFGTKIRQLQVPADI